MKLLIETYISIFITTVCIVVCSSFINSELQINEARDFHSSCVSLIEATDFDAETIVNCQKQAIERGYYKYKCKSCNKTYDKSLDKCPYCRSTNKEKVSLLIIKPASSVSERVKCGNCGTVYDYTATECPNCHQNIPSSYIQNRLYTVELKYNIQISILKIKRTGVINGYAR